MSNKIKYIFGFMLTRCINASVTSFLLILSVIDKEYLIISKDPQEAMLRVENYMTTTDDRLILAACEILLYGKNLVRDSPGQYSNYEIYKIVLIELNKLYFKLKLISL